MSPDAKALTGLISIAVSLGNGIVLVRHRRRSGKTQNYGHPVKDQLLLLTSAIVVTGVFLVVLWWLGPKAPRVRTFSGEALVLFFLLLAAGVSWLANSLLRERKQ